MYLLEFCLDFSLSACHEELLCSLSTGESPDTNMFPPPIDLEDGAMESHNRVRMDEAHRNEH
jgi:hypothetical protein